MNVSINTKIHNRFDIEVRNKDTGELRQKGKAENIILNRGFDKVSSLTAYFSNILFGKGTGTLSPTRTALFSHLGYKAATTESTVEDYPVSKVTKKIVLNPEEYVGETITEVGISENTSNINTHALITDAEGNPLSITKTALDVVTIYATVFINMTASNGVFFDNIIGGNKLLRYFFQNSGLGTVNILTNPCDIKSNIVAGIEGDTSIVATITSNTSLKKITLSGRIGIDSNNRNIACIGISNIAGVYIKETALNPFQIEDLSVGTGDGSKTTFTLPKLASDIIIRNNGNIVNNYIVNSFNNPVAVPLPVGQMLLHALRLHTSGTIISENKAVSLGDHTYIIVNYALTYLPASNIYNAILKIKIENGAPKVLAVKYIEPYGASSISYSTDKEYIRVFRYDTTYKYYRISDFSEVANPGKTWIQTFDNDISTEDGYYFLKETGKPTGLAKINDMEGKSLVFDTAPANGDTITVDCKVPYLPKTADYVIDVTFTIQFGEGV